MELATSLFWPLAVLSLGVLWFLYRKVSHTYRRTAEVRKLNGALLKLSTGKLFSESTPDTSLREIAEICADCLRVERVGIWLFSDDQSKGVAVELFERSLNRHTSGYEIFTSEAGLVFKAAEANRVVVIPDVERDPLTTPILRLRDLNVRSVLAGGLHVNGKYVGLLTISSVKTKRAWTNDEQNFAASLTDLIAMIYEIQERRLLEQELRLKSHAIEASVDGMAIVNKEEQLSFVNKALVGIYGYKHQDELRGQNWRMLCDPEEGRRFEHHLMTTFRRTGNLQIEAVGRRKDGSQFPQELSLTALPGGGFIYVVRDVTRRKEAQLNLIENRLFLRKVIDTDPHFVFVKDAQGRFTLANQAVAEAYGTSVNNLIGKTDAVFNAQMDELERFSEADRYVLETGKELVIPEEKFTDSRGNVHWLQTVKRPLQLSSSQQTHVLGIATDITESKALQTQLVQSQKMEAFGQLAGGIAHDFNNMMTGILGFTTLLKLTYSNQPDVFRTAEMIEHAANRAADLTRKLLAFARQGKSQNVPVDVHAVVRDSVAILSRTVEKSINIVVELDCGQSFVLGDPTQLQQVLINLVINARDALSNESGEANGGQIVITSCEANAQANSDAALPQGQWIALSVRDTGCGIAPQHLTKIFEPFFTTKQEGHGTGLGLSMVYGIVKNHGGTIKVDSVLGAGSTFTIYLPLTSTKGETVVAESQIRVATEKKSILIVDDHQLIRDVTGKMLESLGYQVATAGDGVEAIDYYREHNQEIDLVILDMIMPRMGAKECFKALREINSAARVLLSSGYLNGQNVQELLDAGIVGFVQKPYKLETISQAVAEALKI